MSSSTTEAILSKMQEVLLKYNVSWTNCIGIGHDNTSVNMGHTNSIKTRIVSVNPGVTVIGCHIVHNIACKAGEAYEKVLVQSLHFF